MQEQIEYDQRFDRHGRVRRVGLYDPAREHDSCGVGFVARLQDSPTREVVEKALSVLVNLEHRGAVGGDGVTGDGAGILLEMPDELLREAVAELDFDLPEMGNYATGMIFLPGNKEARDDCIRTLEKAARDEGAEVLGWRRVPTETSGIGRFARDTEPEFRQIFLGRGSIPEEDFERRLYLIERVTEKEIEKLLEPEYRRFYIASLSSRTLVYKGMLTGTQLSRVFPDLERTSCKARFAIVHQRYSTNTLPAWSLAQPFRMLAHNGEINTLRGNVNRMRSREPHLECAGYDAEALEKLKPILPPGLSDSASFDAVLRLLTSAGRSLPHSVMMMAPQAWGEKYHISRDLRAFYDYHSALMEPWDGPAALVFTDGRYIGATLDRNGLRPARYAVAEDGLVVLSSETGVLDLPPEKVHSLGRLQPGRMLLLDIEEQRIVPDREIKARIARRQPYRHWVEENRIELRGLLSPGSVDSLPSDELERSHLAFGYTEEELKAILEPMAANAQEPIGSMGNDTPLSALSHRPRLLFTYFKQLFAQVTNPPIDPLREELVMSLMSYVGREGNLLAETPEHCRQLKLHHPVLTPDDIERLRQARYPELKSANLNILFPADPANGGLKEALDRLFTEAEEAVREGAALLILTDRQMNRQQAPIPVLLAVSGLHHHLIRQGLRSQAGIIVETGEAREVMHFAMLLGFGANGVCPYLAMATARRLAEESMLNNNGISPAKALDNYMAAIKKGLLKTFSRLGISTIRSFTGAQTFQSVGLASELINEYFPHTDSHIGGAGLEEISDETRRRHKQAFPTEEPLPKMLTIGGDYALRRQGGKHLLSAEALLALQTAVRQGDYEKFKQYTELIDDQDSQPVTLRSLFNLRPAADKVPLNEVEPAESIVKRFVCSAMSLGSLSKEAHETLAAGCNLVGARSNSGEGGEDPARFNTAPGEYDKCSRIKQVASGRFGVSTHYAVNCNELQIKMAQGAKPGEGGQLPGHKVTADIARVRNTTEGVTLISPPPHHDIYSIEDIAQLIYDLKCVNSNARVSVKLVSEPGVGTVASGVAKAGADMVQIAGGDGGTGASPLSAIQHCGLPWELGLAEAQQTLQLQGLRERIRVQVDGQLRTGRDLAVAALLGADEFGFATIMLVSIGCVMMRKCHNNTCPVGVATQMPELRKHFTGKPEHVANFLTFLAENLREQMSELGFRSVDEMTGRLDVLDVNPAIKHGKTHNLDFTSLLRPDYNWRDYPGKCLKSEWFEPAECFDDDLIPRLEPAWRDKRPVSLELPIRNVNRTVGARLSAQIIRRHGADGLPDDTITLNFTGSAGQSFGAFLAPGVTMRVAGDVNDYLGKSMSGGRVIVKPAAKARVIPHENVIIGNVALYGAHRGEIFINGLAGERFAVRNSGANAVVEGVGDHGCEYMTGGTVVILGPTGDNFAAGMSGGIAYVYDENGLFDTRCNLDMVDIETVHQQEDLVTLKSMISRHIEHTGSPRAQHIATNWEVHSQYFVKVMPIDYRRALERMRQEQRRDSETISATEEVYDG